MPDSAPSTRGKPNTPASGPQGSAAPISESHPGPPTSGRLPLVALGHSNQPAERFLGTLRRAGVRAVVDIRRFPTSRTVAWANGPELARLLGAESIAYRHEPGLGGKRDPVPGSRNTAWRNASFRAYADHMGTDAFRAALRRLEADSAATPTAILCAEAVPWRCHRSLVADALVARGIPVLQAFGPGDVRPHRMTPFARVRDGEVSYPAEKPLDSAAWGPVPARGVAPAPAGPGESP